MSTLVIENVKDEFLPAFSALSKAISAKCTITKDKNHKKQKLSKFEKSVLKASAEAKIAREKGCRTFKSAKEFRIAVENGEI
ncbi:hypothetical protein ACWIWK_04980 [Helicobacter sp. 23-1048]